MVCDLGVGTVDSEGVKANYLGSILGSLKEVLRMGRLWFRGLRAWRHIFLALHKAGEGKRGSYRDGV